MARSELEINYWDLQHNVISEIPRSCMNYFSDISQSRLCTAPLSTEDNILMEEHELWRRQYEFNSQAIATHKNGNWKLVGKSWGLQRWIASFILLIRCNRVVEILRFYMCVSMKVCVLKKTTFSKLSRFYFQNLTVVVEF